MFTHVRGVLWLTCTMLVATITSAGVMVCLHS